MPKLKKIFFAGFWITFSEFLRNEILFKSYWVEHFSSLGLTFQTLTINGILWTLWSFLFAYLISEISHYFSFYKTVILSWAFGFVLMWIVSFNLQVLPLKVLFFAIPTSIIEVLGACFILFNQIKKEKNART